VRAGKISIISRSLQTLRGESQYSANLQSCSASTLKTIKEVEFFGISSAFANMSCLRTFVQKPVQHFKRIAY